MRQIDTGFDRLHRRRMGAVEHVQFGITRGIAKCLLKNFRRQARTAHAEENNMFDAVRFGFVGKGS